MGGQNPLLLWLTGTADPALFLLDVAGLRLQGLVLSAEVAAALREGKAVVALESTIITHGMPWPQNLETARGVEAVVRAHGGVPATVAVLAGVPHVGLTDQQLQALASRWAAGWATGASSGRGDAWTQGPAAASPAAALGVSLQASSFSAVLAPMSGCPCLAGGCQRQGLGLLLMKD